MSARAYLFVGGPMHGELIAIPEDTPIFTVAKPLPARFMDPDLMQPMQAYESIDYVPDRIGSVDEDGTRWVLWIMVSPDVAKLGPFAKTRLAFGAAIRRLPGVEMHHDPTRR